LLASAEPDAATMTDTAKAARAITRMTVMSSVEHTENVPVPKLHAVFQSACVMPATKI
jgi:hypothetical protein